MLKEFEFDGVKYEIKKIDKFTLAKQFRDICLPLVMPHFRPFEAVISAMINGWANADFALVSTMIQSEREMDDSIRPAFEVLLQFYTPQRVYTKDHLDSSLPNINTLYEIVNSQISVEQIIEFYLKRKVDFFEEIGRYLNINLNLKDIVTKIERVIKEASTIEPDKEFRGITQ